MDSVQKQDGSISHNTVKKCALLLIVGEAFSEDDKKLILAGVTKGFSCWDTELIGFDINSELADIANRTTLDEEGPNGERIIRQNSENLAIEILVDPQSLSLRNALKNFLSLHTKHKHLIYAKHAFQGTGAWMLQDDIFTFHDFAHIFKDTDIDNAIREQHGASMYINVVGEGDWTNNNIAKSDFSKLLNVKLNPPAKLEALHGILQFTAYVSNFVRVRHLNELLQSSGVVGNIRFTRPTLYIFPAGQGDSALLGVNGFNLLVNGGYSRKACFWDFTRHLDRIDAALITHLGADNLYGIQSVFQRKSLENLHPDIGYLYFNAPDKMKMVTEINPEKSGNKESLLVNLAEEGDKLVHYAKQIGLTPQPCLRTAHGNDIKPFNLYQKIGIGSLDMYILNPVTDSKELKDFFHQWNQNEANFGTSRHLSLPNMLSVCALLVWHPADPNVNICRILFPGNAPQHKILEGLEKLKTLDIFKHPNCTRMSLNSKHATKKPAGGLFNKVKSKVSPVITSKNEMPKNEVTKKEVKEPGPSKTASHAKEKPLQKVKKEDVNKKAIKVPEKQMPEKLDKAKQTKPIKSSGPTKGSTKSSAASTPKEKSSPVKTPEPVQAQEVHEDKHESEKEVLYPEQEVHESEQEVHESEQEVLEDDHTPSCAESGNHTSCDLLDTENDDTNQEPESIVEVTALEEPESVVEVTESGVIASEVPDTNQFAPECEQIQESKHLDKAKMSELGIYDDDDDDEQDMENEYDDEPESEEKSQQWYGGMTDSMHQDVYQQDAIQGSFHGDLMTESMHENMFDNEQPFGDQDQNGDNILTPEDEPLEVIQPQALPEPVAYAPDSYIQEPDVIPTFSCKEESEISSCEDSIPKIQNLDILPIKKNLYDLAVSDNKADNQVEIFEHKNTSPEYDHSLIKIPEKITNVVTQECVEDNEYIEEIIVEENEQVNSVAAMLDNAAEDVKGRYIDMDVPSFITGDLRLPSPNDKDDPVEGQEAESHIDEHDVLRQGKGDKANDPFLEMQQVEETSRVPDTMERSTVLTEPAVNLEDEHTDDFDEKADHKLEQEDFQIPEVNQERLTTANLLEFVRDENEDIYQADDQHMIENKLEDKTRNEVLAEKNYVPCDFKENQDSEDVGISCQKGFNRDLLEKEYYKETSQSPEPESEELKGGMEIDYEQQQAEADGLIFTCDDKDEANVSENNESDQLERDMHDEIAECERNLEQTENVLNLQKSVEREAKMLDVPNASLHCDSDQHESADQSYEDKSDKSEQEDVDDESSSYEPEEATDEKCLIQDSNSEDYQGRPFEVVQGDLIVEQTSDNLLTPESELTDPSTGGQMGYHQIDDQGDYADGFDDQDCSYTGGPAVFNPSTVWGEPMGLPLPSPPGDKTEDISTATAKNSPKPKLLSKANDAKKTNEKKLVAKVHTASTVKTSAPAPKSSAASNGVTENTKSPSSTDGVGDKMSLSKPTADLIMSKASTVDKVAPANAATKPRSAASASSTDSRPKQNGAKRPATANVSVLSPASVKMLSLPPFSSYCFDLTYIPSHGNSNYVGVEFFKHVRARYYVLSSLSPNTQVLDALLEGKRTWEDKILPVTVIPTYDNETMQLWMMVNKDKLAEENVEIAPSASRCTIQLQDHETSSSAYRLEF